MVHKDNVPRCVKSDGPRVPARSNVRTRHVRGPISHGGSHRSDTFNRVKNKLEKGDGMSLSEFCYPVMQAWDWWHLYKKGTQVQIGGADQFGNILAGAEAVKYMAKNDGEWLNQQKSAPTNTFVVGNRNDPEWLQRHRTELDTRREKENRTASSDPMGFTVPLLTTAAGEKFGKSAGNAIWLDKEMTNSFDLYQVSSLLLTMNAS